MTSRPRIWTAGDVLALGVRTSVPVAGEILGGLSRTQSYMAVEHGKFPVPVLRVGRRMVVPTAPILLALGIESGPIDGGPAPPDMRMAASLTDAATATETRLTRQGSRHAHDKHHPRSA